MDKPLKGCPEPGCPNLVVTTSNRSARCAEHATPSPYDHEWRELRAWKLTNYPWCERCRAASAREVDHIIAIRSGGARLDPRNLRSLCVDCHRRVTPREYTVRPRANYRRSRERAHRPR